MCTHSRALVTLFALAPLAACLDVYDDTQPTDEAPAEVTGALSGDGCTSGAQGACDGLLTMSFDGGTWTLPYYRNHALGAPPSTIKRAVIVLHGAEREPWKYFDAVVKAASTACKLGETIILTPYFEEVPSHTNGLCWVDSDWPIGGYTGPGCGDVSTFEVVDHIVDRLLDRSLYPNLTTIVFTGHSAGGQLVQRYAGLGKRINGARPAGLSYRFVPANPSSYMYLTPTRWVNGAWGTPAGCPSTFDDYAVSTPGGGYGLQDRTGTGGYLDDYSPSLVRSLYVSRDMHYLAGTKDIYVTSDRFDDSCPAMAQGKNRLERAVLFGWYLDQWFPEHDHELVLVPGVGHSAPDIYASAEGRGALFD